ncbi:hypothetical protein [Williamsia sp. CHRR-6]|nr:hypothetical protein [Williamsia sp. CHRR-6]MBT0566137.1 hypothetical protein [Williamsia sp. CHRR-6]
MELTTPDNLAGRRVLGKCGFIRMGIVTSQDEGEFIWCSKVTPLTAAG